MRIYASKTRRAAVLAVALCAASCGTGCATKPKAPPPPHGPPPAYVVVRHEHVTLRAASSLELHAMLATAARNDEPLSPEFEPARAAYARALADDDDDQILRETFRGLDLGFEGGATDALAKVGLANAFHRAEAHFAPEWETRSRITWAAIARAEAALDERADGVLTTLTKALGITWRTVGPLEPGAASLPSVDVVAESPPAGRKALLTPLLAARGPCFAGAADNSVNNARIVDCVLVRALLSGHRPAGFSERFFTVLVAHTVAALVTSYEPQHASVDRRAIAAVEPATLAFITAEWHGGAVTPDLERRYRAKAISDPDAGPASPASR